MGVIGGGLAREKFYRLIKGLPSSIVIGNPCLRRRCGLKTEENGMKIIWGV